MDMLAILILVAVAIWVAFWHFDGAVRLVA
jgi:hypothetical protein